MLPVMRKHGRPKGADLTAIGLPKRRRSDGPQKFRLRLPHEREKVMLLWFVSAEAAMSTLHSQAILSEEQVGCRVGMPAAVDDNVCLLSIQTLFISRLGGCSGCRRCSRT